MEVSYNILNEELVKYMDEHKREEVNRAFLFSSLAHESQIRKSGEPYIIHPISVATILAKQKLPSVVIIAGLLHDVVEDTEYTLKDIEEKFSKEVAAIVDGVTKLTLIEDYTYDQILAANHRKILVSAAKDVRVLFIKLADRLHNMHTLKYMNQEKQKLIANETLEVYAPIAHRLGMYEVKWELEDLSFKVINPGKYKEIANKLEIKRSEREEIVNKLMFQVDEIFNSKNIEVKIKGRSKHIYSIHKKILQGKHFEDILDLFAFRIIVTTISECYIVLGIIHEHFKPIPLRFKDYIPTPKHNMYQSIHTTVLTEEGFPIEFQIRTDKMDYEAEYGIAAHWAYKEGNISSSDEGEMDKKLVWLRKLVEDGSLKEDSTEFMSHVKGDYFAKTIFVYTPQGDIIELPEQSTVLDFAFYVHTKLGLEALSAKVNEKVVSLFYKLQMGDVVTIITSPHAYPSINWIAKVKTLRAKDKLKKYFKKEENKKIQEEGYKLFLNLKNEYSNIDTKVFDDTEKMNALMQKFNIAKKEKFYLAIGLGEIELDDIVNYLHSKKDNKKIKKVIIQDFSEDYEVKLCKYCSPILGDEIKAVKTNVDSVNQFYIHRVECSEDGQKYNANFIEENEDISYVCRFEVELEDSPYEFYNLLGVLKELNAGNITRVYARGGLDGVGKITISVEITSLKQYQKIKEALLARPTVISVRRLIKKGL